METLSLSFWEATRLAANHFSQREALEDTQIKVHNKKYHIKKGMAVLLFPTMLMDDEAFEKALEFNPDRHKNLTKDQKKAIIPFGGGKHMLSIILLNL